MDVVKNMLGYRRVHTEGQIGVCEMCGKTRRLYDDLCLKCRGE